MKDVLVSDPGVLDAVVQSSDRVFLIAKKAGQTNAFFFDEYGQQILTLEVAIGADLSSLDQLLTRLIPGSNIHSEIAGRAIVLTGSVRTPVDSNMAAQIANPRDIVAPRTMTLGDSHRSIVVFDNYRKGVRTSAPQEELISARVARAVE